MKSNRIMKIFKSFSFLIILNFILLLYAFALEVETHQAINSHIVGENSAIYGIYLDNYLKNNLGMRDGVKTLFDSKMAKEWISDGGIFEDKPSGCVPFWRSRNHFHNPKDKSGFSGWWDTGIFKCMSVVDWINQPVNMQVCGNYSWHDVRYYYYCALWSDSKADSEKYFAQTFRGLGQMMHLVQDMSVPEHTRNDGHYFFYDYEVWAKGLKISNYSAQTFAPSEAFPLSVNNLFDTNRYSGMNPEVTTQPAIGLAEYSNANFLSPDNIFKVFIYPSYGSAETNIDKSTDKNILYLKKTGNGENIEYLARANNFYNYLPGDYKKLALTLNDPKVYENYAAKLIPRAIGYSSQVLSYFFRGEIEAKLLPVFDAEKLKSVHIKVRNITPSKERMGGQDSVFMLAYRYTPRGAPEDGSGDIYGKVPYSYLLFDELMYGKDDSGNDLEGDAYEAEIYLYPFPLEIPIVEYQHVKFMLIYRGNLGEEMASIANNESGGIIGKFGAAKPLGFHEEWNTSPNGDYHWFQMESTVFGSNYCPEHNAEHGLAQNEITEGKLVKTNIRYQTDCNIAGHFNYSFIGVDNLSGETYANNIFPIPVTKNTYIEFKIDEMSISQKGNFINYQGMVFSFNNGYKLQLSLDGQFWYDYNAGYFTFDKGEVIVDNIHNMFKQLNKPVPTNFALNSIYFVQQIGHGMPLQVEQRMVVDFVRIVEMGPMSPTE